jgi:hypothetical protein
MGMVTFVHCGCGRDNDPWRRFCGACGAAIALACACGFGNKVDDRFCGGCGTVRRAEGKKPHKGAPKLLTIPIDVGELLPPE